MIAPRAVYANHVSPPPAPLSIAVRLGRLLASGRVRTLIAVAVLAPLIGAEVGMLLARAAPRPPLTLRGPISGLAAPPAPLGPPPTLAELAETDVQAQPFILPAGRAGDRARAARCLADAIYYEAALEPVEGRRAVAQVVLNRVRDPNFPKSVCGVVYDGWKNPAGCQFTFACDGSLARPPRPGLYRDALDIANQALSGRVEPSVGLATHYHATSVDPRWRGDMVRVAQVGSQIFYRWPGPAGRSGAFTGRYVGGEAVPPAADLLARAAVPAPAPDAAPAPNPPVFAADQPVYLNGRRIRSQEEVRQMNQWLEEKRPTTAASS